MSAPQPVIDDADDTQSPRAKVSRLWSTNPFFVLGANPRDQRRRIVELAEDLALQRDLEAVSKARADLTHPRTRLTAEMAWLPGVSPARASECVKAVVADPGQADTFKSLPSLAYANVLAVAFDGIDAEDGRRSPCSLEAFAAVVEKIDVAEVRRHINEDRSISGFPEIANSDWIESELADRRRVYRASVRSWMERSETRLMLSNLISSVEHATSEGKSHPPLLIAEVVADYELSAQPALAKAEDALKKLFEHGRLVAPQGAAQVTATLVEVERFLKEWEHLSRPQQLCAKARGEEHRPSIELAARVRGLGVDLANKYDLYDAAYRITWLMREAFFEVPSIIEKVDEDATAVKALLGQQKKATTDKKAFEQEITYHADIGMLVKTRLAISPLEVQWGNLRFPLESITRIRWGGVKHSVNFIPTGTDYHILFGNDSRAAEFSLSKKQVYDDFTDKLWRAVGYRIMLRYAEGLRAGKTFKFGDILVSDDGCEISKPKFFGAERIKAPWSDLQIWSSNGNLAIGIKTNQKVSSSASYKEDDNTHLLESMIRAFFKNAAAKRLSDAFLK